MNSWLWLYFAGKGFVDRLDVGSKRKRRVNDGSKVFSLSGRRTDLPFPEIENTTEVQTWGEDQKLDFQHLKFQITTRHPNGKVCKQLDMQDGMPDFQPRVEIELWELLAPTVCLRA